MSSQRLQAQRGGSRPATLNQQRESGDFTDANAPPVPSIFSDQTNQGPGIDDSGHPPPSRGTEISVPETYMRTMSNTMSNTSPTRDVHGHYSIGSLSSSVRPLQHNPNAAGLSVNTNYRSQQIPTPSKSPHSFRSSFLLPTRTDISPHSPNRSTQGHEKLSSGNTSPAQRQSTATLPAPSRAPPPDPRREKNYQYFPGNTRFWLGGRLQNARDRPVNIATGFFVVLPAVLFFVFSAPWLWHNVSPAIPVVFAYIFYICFSSFIHASVSDPGVSLPLLLPPFLTPS